MLTDCYFLAAALLFALYSGGFKCSGVILVELTAKYDGVYSQATLLWVLTLKYIIAGLIGKPKIGLEAYIIYIIFIIKPKSLSWLDHPFLKIKRVNHCLLIIA